MKTMPKKLLALALAAALTVSLAACGKKDVPAPDPSPSPSASLLPAPEVDFLPDNAVDVVQQLLGYPGSTTLLTVNATPVTAEEYLYWLGTMASYYDSMFAYYYGSTLNMDDTYGDGVTWDQELKQMAYDNAVYLSITPAVAAQYGVTLTQEDNAELIQQRQSGIDSSSREEYAYQLQAMGISDARYFGQNQLTALSDKLQEEYVSRLLSGEGEEAITAEEMAAYLEENGTLRAKHILLLTKDMDTGEAYDEAKKAEQKAKAEDILAQVKADPSQFDRLMNENSEDSGLSSFPDGYLFGPNEMVTEFETATKNLAVGEISGLVESSYGYHIILRLDADCDESRETYAAQKFQDMMQTHMDAATVETTPEYEALTTKGYYEALVNFQQSLEEPTTDDQSNATLEPQPNDAPTTDTPTPATPDPAGE